MRRSRSSPLAASSAVTSSTLTVLPDSARARARRTAWEVGSAMSRRAYYEPARTPATLCPAMRVVALAGGIGAGKFLRGLVRAVPPADVTVVVNTADDIELHGLHVSPDLDSVAYWLGGAMDRERGWGRRDETFRATGELGRFGAEGSWFALGDLDFATHLFRTGLLRSGATLSEATARVAAGFGVACRILPMSDDPVTTRIDAVTMGRQLDLHFQEYWVQRH